MYVHQLVAALEDAINILNSERYRRFPEIGLSNLKSSGDGLRAGDVWQDSGTLRVVRAGDTYATTLVGTTGVGSVTIVTS
jgi:hypothetical protein